MTDTTDQDPTPDSESYITYIGFTGNVAKGIMSAVQVTTDQEKVVEWSKRKQEESPADLPGRSGKVDYDDDDNSVRFSLVMIRIRETITSFYPLINASLVLMPSLRTGYITDHMYNSARETCEQISATESCVIYGVPSGMLPPISRQIRRLRELDRGMELLPAAVLMGMIATFDSGIVDLIRLMIAINPARVDNSSKSLTVSEILSMNSFDDVRQRIIDDEIDDLMKGSHSEQIEYIERAFSIKIKSEYARWKDLIEIFERRNIAAHGDLIVNRRYVDNVTKHGGKNVPEIGKVLPLDPKYLQDSADILLEFIMTLCFVLWRKYLPDDAENSYKRLGVETFELIRDGRYAVAARVLSTSLGMRNIEISDRQRKVLTINLVNALKKNGDAKEALKTLDETDWTAASVDFRLCEASLREDVESFVSLMPQAIGLVSKEEFREWPVFDWVRINARVKEKFIELFGETFVSDDKTNFDETGLRLGGLAVESDRNNH